MMTPRIWSEITGAHEDLSRLVNSTFGGSGKAPDLGLLRARLRRRLDELLGVLAPHVTSDTAVAVLLPMVLLVDEQVQMRLPREDASERPGWLLLQRDLLPDGDGGDVFYERAAGLLREVDASPLLVGVYLFCLEAGFQGRLVDDPRAIPGWKAQLRERLAVVAPGGTLGAPVFARARSASEYALVAVAAVVVVEVVLWAVARSL
jgi:hypothetical protein